MDIIWILIAVLLGIIVLAAGIVLIIMIIKMIFFRNALKEFKKRWKEHKEWND